MGKISGCYIKILIVEILFTILLIFMFQYIMGQRVYYDLSPEPMKNENTEVVNGESAYVQEVVCKKEFLKGIMVFAHSDEVEDAELFVQVYDDAGTKLAEASQLVSKEGYTTVIFDRAISDCNEKILKVILSTNEIQKIMIQGSEKNVNLQNAEKNVCIRLIYNLLDTGKYKVCVYLIGGIFWIILSLVLVLILSKNTKHEYIFAFLYFTLGIMYMIVIPMSAAPDEGAHFMRIYGISEGNYVAEYRADKGTAGSDLPDNILSGFKSNEMKLPDVIEGKESLLSENKVFVSYAASALYSPFTYTAQVIGVKIGKMISNKIFIIAYCGRIAAWLVVGGILFLSIKHIPVGKNILMAISLLPMNMHESISLAGDSFTFSVVAALISFVLYLRYRKEEYILGWKEYVILYALLFYVASCKIVYVPLCLLVCLIPAKRFGNRRNYIKNMILAALDALLTSGIWMYISMNILNGSLGGKSKEQITYILMNPLSYVSTVVNTTITYGEGFVKGMLGSSLGWLNVSVNFGIIIMVVINLVYICVQENNGYYDENRVWNCAIMLAASIGVISLIYTSLYVQWTDIGKNIIDGIQGRYFIPILLPVILSMKHGKVECHADNMSTNRFVVSYLMLLITNIFTVVTLLTHFII